MSPEDPSETPPVPGPLGAEEEVPAVVSDDGAPRPSAAVLRAEPGGGRRGDLSPETAGYRQRRLAARHAQRRRFLLRAGLIGASLMLIVALVLLVASFVTGSGSDDDQGQTAAEPASGAVLLILNEDDQARAAVLVKSAEGRAVVLGMPASTLLAGPSGFESLQALLRQEEPASVRAALGLLLGVEPQLATATWTGLRRALAEAGDQGAWPETLPAGPDAALKAADAVAALAALTPAEKGRQAVEKLAGGGGGLVDALRAAAKDPAVAGLPGRLVEGDGYTYYEPDPAQARLLVGGESGGDLSVEIQNGSGVVGVSEAATAVLVPLGYEMLPPRNADQFPDVADTQILAPADSLGEAARIQTALGVGRVVERKELPARRVVVVLGKDVHPEQLTTTTVPGTAAGGPPPTPTSSSLPAAGG